MKCPYCQQWIVNPAWFSQEPKTFQRECREWNEKRKFFSLFSKFARFVPFALRPRLKTRSLSSFLEKTIVNPVWECHVEQDFCSGECGMRFVYGELIGKPIPHSLWSLNVLLGAKFEFVYKADDFAEEYFVAPFVISNDVVNDWLLFLNHKQYGYIHLADLNRLASIIKLILNGGMQTVGSFLLADFLDSVGTIISRGHWVIGPIHIYCDETDGWSWGMKTDVQHT